MNMSEYPWSDATHLWEQDGIAFALVPHPSFPARLNGYCCFPQKPVSAPAIDGILTYVPVHGGITYCETLADGAVVYGFDCGHGGDDAPPHIYDLAWLKAHTQAMARSIQLAAEIEPAYLAADSEEARAQIITTYHRRCELLGATFELTNNLGAMMNVLLGRL